MRIFSATQYRISASENTLPFPTGGLFSDGRAEAGRLCAADDCRRGAGGGVGDDWTPVDEGMLFALEEASDGV